MDSAEVERWVGEGIAAIRRGERARARDLLLRAVEADERNQRAWLWLSMAVDDPADKLVALENVTIVEAMQARARLPVSLEPDGAGPSLRLPPTEPLAGYAPPSPQEVDDGILNPYQCAYCGGPAERDEKRCPRCDRDLLVRRPKPSQAMASLRFVVLLLALDGVLGLMQLLGPVNVVFGWSESFRALFEWIGSQSVPVMGIKSFLGNFTALSPSAAAALAGVGVARSALLFAAAIGFASRASPVYYATLVGMIADLIGSASLYGAGYGGWLAMGINAVLAVAILALAFATDRDFHVSLERRLTIPDRNAHGALDFFRRGLEYRRRGMWALAVAQWRQAVALRPTEPIFYKDLGIGYAQIGRFGRSLQVLEQAARLAPGDWQIAEIIALVKSQSASAARNGGRPA